MAEVNADDVIDVTAEIRAELARQRISQTALAKHLGLSKQSMSDRLRGDTRLSVEELIAIAAYLHVPAKRLLPSSAA